MIMIKLSSDSGRNRDIFFDDLWKWQRTKDWSWGLAIQGDDYDRYDDYDYYGDYDHYDHNDGGDDEEDDGDGGSCEHEASVAVCLNLKTVSFSNILW